MVERCVQEQAKQAEAETARSEHYTFWHLLSRCSSQLQRICPALLLYRGYNHASLSLLPTFTPLRFWNLATLELLQTNEVIACPCLRASLEEENHSVLAFNEMRVIQAFVVMIVLNIAPGKRTPPGVQPLACSDIVDDNLVAINVNSKAEKYVMEKCTGSEEEGLVLKNGCGV